MRPGITWPPASQPASTFLLTESAALEQACTQSICSHSLPSTLGGSPFCSHKTLRKLPLTHPVSGKGSAPAKKGLGERTVATGRLDCCAASTATQQGTEATSPDGGWPSGSWVGPQWAGAWRWWPSTLQAREALGPSTCPACPLTLPRVLPVGPQCLSFGAGPSWQRLEVCGRQCLWDVFSRCFCCCFTSQFKGWFQTWPKIPGHPPMGRWSLVPLPLNTGQPSDSLLTNGIRQK